MSYALVCTLLLQLVSAALTLSDHLVPPPLPAPQRLIHHPPLPQAIYNFAHDTRKLQYRPPPAAPAPAPPVPAPTQASYGATVQDQAQSQSQSQPNGGFMTRIARWFGFGGSPREQQLSATSGAGSYAYPKPNQPYELNGSGKEACNLCNKYPWVPMAQQGSRHQQQQTPWQQTANLEPQPSQHVPVKQRAVQFNFVAGPPPTLQQQQQHQPSGGAFLPIPVPVPNLSSVALPPLYNAQPFRPLTTSSTTPPSAPPGLAFTLQDLPNTTPAHFTENVGAHSELQAAHVSPSSNFEIVKSHQLTDYVTSVEYPATFVQAHAIDLGKTVATQLPANHKANGHYNGEQSGISTVEYQLTGAVNGHVPASQLLTELGNYAPSSQIFEQTSTTPTPQYEYEAQPTVAVPALQQAPQESYYDTADNYPAASSQQQQQAQQSSFQPWRSLYYETTMTLPTTPGYEPLEEYTTTERYTEATTTTTTTTTTAAAAAAAATDIEILHVPAAAVPNAINNHLQQAPPQPPQAPQRGTPKRLLDAPVKYAQNGLPRPFTRDPAELSFRKQNPAAPQPTNHAYNTHADDANNAASLYVTPTPAAPASAVTSTHAPTPTSTYGAIDASGQYAGMSPPLPPAGAGIHQVVIPYTTKNKPRPFEPTRAAHDSRERLNKQQQAAWGTIANDIELHEQQESKLVRTATVAPPPNTRRTTKYLTKILASNLRELLKRERETKHKALGFDISKLQKNIDGWTEQEYTSLSHRPSTPTIRGRSKHIPSEYLTTTTMATPTAALRQAKTTRAFNKNATSAAVPDVSELSTSINNLEQLLSAGSARNTQRLLPYVPHIDDNSLLDYYELRGAQQRQRAAATSAAAAATTPTTTTTTTTTTTSTTTTPHPPTTASTQLTQFNARTPPLHATELWKKAKVAISPQTNEKVYVVTPQPRYYPQRTLVTPPDDDVTEAPRPQQSLKSPRFLVRPTPGSAVRQPMAYGTNAHQHYSPDIFGLMGLSAYVPADPVEIIDGNSKVITIVTPASAAMQEQQQQQQQRSHSVKSTMSPSPR